MADNLIYGGGSQDADIQGPLRSYGGFRSFSVFAA
jgi:hypothetical protein